MTKLSEELISTIKNNATQLDKEYDLEDLVSDVLGIFFCQHCNELYIRPIRFYDDYITSSKVDAMEINVGYCVSGGIYSVTIQCPDCGEEINVMKG